MVGLFRAKRRDVYPDMEVFEPINARWMGPLRFFTIGMSFLAAIITVLEFVPWP